MSKESSPNIEKLSVAAPEKALTQEELAKFENEVREEGGQVVAKADASLAPLRLA